MVTSTTNSTLVHGIKWLFLLNIMQKLVTFLTNLWVLRSISIQLSGAISLSLELYLRSCLCLRDVTRLSVLRLGDDVSPIWRWTSTVVGLVFTLGITIATDAHLDFRADFRDWDETRRWYTWAVVLECLAEPLYLDAHARLDFHTKALAEGLAFTIRALVLGTLVRTGVDDVTEGLDVVTEGLLAPVDAAPEGLLSFSPLDDDDDVSFSPLDAGSRVFGQAQVAYALTWAAVLAWQYRRHRTPTCARSGGPSSSACTALASHLVVQTLVKVVLAEGDKVVLNTVASLHELGRYSLAFHWGSLAPRILFLPLEDVSKAVFSRREHLDRPLFTLALMLKVVHYIGLSILAFGPAYTHVVLTLVLGPDKAQGTSTVLSWYCLYVALCAGNGILEAYVHSSSSAQELMTVNGYLVLSFLLSVVSVYICVGPILDLGAVGIVLANCINMIGRMSYCLKVIHERHGGQFQWRQGLPEPLILWLLALAFLVTQVSQRLWLTSEAQLNSWPCIVAHAAIGGVTALLVLFVSYRQERQVLIPQFLALRAHAHQE